jgi:hypothetical protein
MSTSKVGTNEDKSHSQNDHNLVDHAEHNDQIESPKITLKAITLGLCASMGGMVFGYESGQISGTWCLFLHLLMRLYDFLVFGCVIHYCTLLAQSS